MAAHKGIAALLSAPEARGLAAGTVIGVVAVVGAAAVGLRRPAPDDAVVPRMAVP